MLGISDLSKGKAYKRSVIHPDKRARIAVATNNTGQNKIINGDTIDVKLHKASTNDVKC